MTIEAAMLGELADKQAIVEILYLYARGSSAMTSPTTRSTR